MELIFGKRIMRELDRVLEELNGDERHPQASYEALTGHASGHRENSPNSPANARV